jgi:cysteinyl-tRNA synthetase
MAIRLYDSLTREVRELGQREPGAPPVSAAQPFTFYNCGPTVYGPAHIGNFRTFVVNDVLRRLLMLEFGADAVRYVRNITDVDDKTIRRAREEGRPLAEVTQRLTEKFHADCAALNILPMDPGCEPTATGFIPKQVAMINELLRKGHAYVSPDGSVYFKVESFAPYGALSRVKERNLLLGSALAHKSQAADADEKEDGSDFALWKAWKPEDGPVKWPGPSGAAEGRPGWHIECSAMSRELLGETIDLHTGGVDLLFPHHENEIAQSEGCSGHRFSRHWYHSEFLLVDGKKMSKSLGNLYTLDDLTAKGFSPMAVRYALLSGHPRKQLNFTLESLHAAEKAITTLSFDRARMSAFSSGAAATRSNRFDRVMDALKEDMNLPAALGELFTAARSTAATQRGDLQAFNRVLSVLGIDLDSRPAPPETRKVIPASVSGSIALGGSVEAHTITVVGEPGAQVQSLAERRWAAKQAKDFKAADALRAEIIAAGWSMLDGKDGYKLAPLKR